MIRRGSALAVVAWVVAVWGCASAQRAWSTTPRASQRSDQDAQLRAFASRIASVLGGAAIDTVLVPDIELESLLQRVHASTLRARRLRAEVAAPALEAVPALRAVSICVQGARDEAPGATLGLRRPAWVFERALVGAETPTHRRVGAWIEGVFVTTPFGIRALAIDRVEPPRWRHADLDLADCDVRVER